MKCHCKYCLPRFFCQTVNENDFCYYRYPLKTNGTNDFGCVQADVARFLVRIVFFEKENNNFVFSVIQQMQIIEQNVVRHFFAILIIH